MGFFKDLGRGFASLMQGSEHISRGVGDAIGKAGTNLVDYQKVRHETIRQREQNAFTQMFAAEEHARALEAARYRAGLEEEAAARAHTRALEAAEHRAALEEEAAARAHIRALDRDSHRALCEIVVQTTMLQTQAELAESPFIYTERDVHSMVAAKTVGKKRPALLLADFSWDDVSYNNDWKDPFRTSFHYVWERQPWQEDLGRLTGLFRRPLRSLDVDSLLVKRVLADLPVILVHGEVQAGTRLWVTIEIWNGSAGGLRVVLPFTGLPPLSAPTAEHTKFQDGVAEQCLFIAEIFGEWYHVARGREPRLHRVLPSFAEPLGPVVAAGSAAMLDIALSEGQVDPVLGALYQARTYQEAGLRAEAVEALAAARVAGPTGDRKLFLARARLLAEILGEFGDEAGAAVVRGEAESAAVDLLRERSRWGD